MDPIKVNRTARRMTEVRARMLKGNPFFGHLAMGMQLSCAPCETAFTDGSRIVFDPEFAENLSDRELEFVFLHEILHCVLEHCRRGKGLEQHTHNIACDIVVNSIILQMWGMDTFAVNGMDAMHLVPDGREGRLFNSEEVYAMLLSCRPAMPDPDAGGFPQAGSGTEPDTGGTFDRHDLWQGIADPAKLRDDWHVRIRKASKACGNSAGMPQAVRSIVDELVRGTGRDWCRILHDFIQFDEKDYIFAPPDRRYAACDFFLPAYGADEDRGTVRDIWVCVDTSGSVSDALLAAAWAEILDAMRQTGLNGKVSFFDSAVSEPEPFADESDLKEIRPVGGGGTSFVCIFRYMQKYMYPELPKAILIFTDGYAACPEEIEAMGVPVLWLISRGGRTDLPWGEVTEL